jgi:hypothetical protein
MPASIPLRASRALAVATLCVLAGAAPAAAPKGASKDAP